MTTANSFVEVPLQGNHTTHFNFLCHDCKLQNAQKACVMTSMYFLTQSKTVVHFTRNKHCKYHHLKWLEEQK